MYLLILLPLIAVFLLTAVFYFYNQADSVGFEKLGVSVINSIIVVSLYLAIATELLSSYTLITFWALLITWMLAVIGVSVFIVWRKIPVNEGWKTLPALFRNNKTGFLVLAVLLISLSLALIYPANNYDANTYHMARMAHWEQNHSVAHYKTHIVRQLVFPPLGEWIILHAQVLTKSDFFANAVQLLFFAANVLMVMLIARKLGGNKRQQIIAALMASFIPMAILESNTTQNDLTSAFYVLAFIFYSTTVFKRVSIAGILLCGVSLGLAWLSKGSAYLYLIVFCGWYVLIILKGYTLNTGNLLKKAGLFLLIPIIALSLNSGHYYRNLFYADSPMGGGGEGTINEGFAVKPLLFVALKNIMNHLPVSKEMKNKVTEMEAKQGLEPDDPKYNFVKIGWMAEGFSFHEDYAQNFPQLFLMLVCIVSFFVKRRLYASPPNMYLLFVLSLLLTCFLFTVLLKWQPWSNRLQTPIFMLFAVFFGMEIGQFSRPAASIINFIIIIYGSLALFMSSRRPVFPISHSIFGEKTYNDFIYEKALLQLKSYLDTRPHKKIGIFIGADSWDYIYYKLLRRKNNGEERQLNHVFVQNPSKMYIDDFVPDALITLETSLDKYTIKGKEYYRQGIYSNVALFEPK